MSDAEQAGPLWGDEAIGDITATITRILTDWRDFYERERIDLRRQLAEATEDLQVIETKFGQAELIIADLTKQLAEVTAEADDLMVEQLRLARSIYEAKLAECQQRLAEASVWQPNDLEFRCGAATIAQIGAQLLVNLYGETLQVDLPPGVRLCIYTTRKDTDHAD